MGPEEQASNNAMHHIFQTPYACARHYDEVKNPNSQLQRGPKSCIFFTFTIK